jgi:hypothetical protein
LYRQIMRDGHPITKDPPPATHLRLKPLNFRLLKAPSMPDDDIILTVKARRNSTSVRSIDATPTTGAIAVAAAGVAFVAFYLTLATGLTIWDFTQNIIAACALFMGTRFLLQLERWRHKGYLKGKSLRRILVRPFTIGRCVAMFAIAVLCYGTPTQPILVIASTILLGFLSRCSIVFERNIQAKLDVAKRAWKYAASARAPFLRVYSPAPRETRLYIRPPFRKTYRSIRIHRVVLEEVEDLRNRPTTRWFRYYARAAPLLALISVFSFIGSAAGLVTNPKDQPVRPRRAPTTAHAEPIVNATTTTTASAPTSAIGLTATSTRGALEGTCTNESAQSGISPAAIRSINKLYEQESRLTTSEEGCVRHISAHHFGHESYFTAIGVAPGTSDALSYAIDSERYGPVIFLQPIAPMIKKLVTKVGPVGGVTRFPHYEASQGDFYLTRSPEGIYMFIRRTPADAYERLSPTVARALLGVAKEYGAWLWPSQPEQGAHGQQTIHLRSADSSGWIRDAITLDTFTGEAQRSRYHYPALPVKELDLAEVVALASTA